MFNPETIGCWIREQKKSIVNHSHVLFWAFGRVRLQKGDKTESYCQNVEYFEHLTGQTYEGYQNAAGTESVCLCQVSGEPCRALWPDQTHLLKKLLYFVSHQLS